MDSSENKIQKQTSLWIGLALLAFSVMYALVSLGRTEWLSWMAVGSGLFISVFLFIQAGVFEYFRKKDYRKIGFGDVVVWTTVAVSIAIFLNSLFLIQFIGNAVPSALRTFLANVGVITGSLGGLLAILHIFMPRFK